MTDLTPRQPHRPLRWSDAVYQLRDALSSSDQPIFIVGGAVRDALLHHPLKDLDLTVPTGAIRLARRIADRMGGAFFPLDIMRDVGRVLLDTADGRLIIDVARFRGDDLGADLADRDYTVNAMAVALDGALDYLIDPLGGEYDAQSRLVRRCGPDAVRNDPVRCLRAVRLGAQLDMRIVPDTISDIRANGHRLAEMSPERVRDELFRLLALPKAAAALRTADALGLLLPIMPELTLVREQPNAWNQTLSAVENMGKLTVAFAPHRSDNLTATFGLGLLVMQLSRFRVPLQSHLEHMWPNERPHRALLLLAALLHHTGPDQTLERATGLRLSNDERERLTRTVHRHSDVLGLDARNARALYRFWRDTGVAGIDVCLLAAARYLAEAGSGLEQDAWLNVIEQMQLILDAYFSRYTEIVEPPMLIDGTTLMRELELRAGPVVGRLLETVREAQAAGEVKSAAEALDLARALLRETDHR